MSAIRETCGTAAGILAHQRAGEAVCAFCTRAERIAAIEAEGIPRGLPAPPPKAAEPTAPIGGYRPVTDHQAAEHCAALLRELDDRAGVRHLRVAS
jgi:hypothetical protein